MRDGFFVARGVVSPADVAAALSAINAELCRPGSVEARDDGGVVVRCDAAGALLHRSPRLLALVEALLGTVDRHRSFACQVALRPPDSRGPPQNRRGTEWHCDGMVRDDPTPFNLLVGVALSDQSVPGAGQLIVYPGSHVVVHEAYRDRVRHHNGVLFRHGDDPNKPRFFNPHDVLLAPGDAVILHQKTAHKAGVNSTPHIRYQLYWRLSNVNRTDDVRTGRALDDLWSGFDGLRASPPPYQEAPPYTVAVGPPPPSYYEAAAT